MFAGRSSARKHSGRTALQSREGRRLKDGDVKQVGGGSGLHWLGRGFFLWGNAGGGFDLEGRNTRNCPGPRVQRQRKPPASANFLGVLTSTSGHRIVTPGLDTANVHSFILTFPSGPPFIISQLNVHFF